jgi:DNA-directed RNA polymerase subunit RPC12/RpoP
MNNQLVVTIHATLHHPIIAALKVIIAVIILLLSLLLYLAGLILTLTIIGAILGIPIILSTYALDVLALAVLMNPRRRAIKTACPNCGKGKYVIPFAMESYRCKRCKRAVQIKVDE